MLYLKNKSLISLIIVAILGLQIIFGLVIRSDWYWPFTHYPMYTAKKENGETLDVEYQLTVGFSDGPLKNVTKEDLSLTLFQWNWHLRDALLSEDDIALNNIKNIIENKYNSELKFIKLKDYPAKITKQGIEKKESIVIKQVTF